MKSYIIRIELEESNPLIWRRVIMPAGATFKSLHDIIQNVTRPISKVDILMMDITSMNLI